MEIGYIVNSTTWTDTQSKRIILYWPFASGQCHIPIYRSKLSFILKSLMVLFYTLYSPLYCCRWTCSSSIPSTPFEPLLVFWLIQAAVLIFLTSSPLFTWKSELYQKQSFSIFDLIASHIYQRKAHIRFSSRIDWKDYFIVVAQHAFRKQLLQCFI